MNINKVRFLSGNAIKFIAAILMVVDHVGLVFFPTVMVFRHIGRLSMPLFAFMIAEGTRYTKNKLKYLLAVFTLAVICQIAYYIFAPNDLYFSILVTFTFSIVCIYALQFMKKCLLEREVKLWLKVCSALLFVLVIFTVNVFCRYFVVDYGYWGCMLPVFASLFDFRRVDNESVKKYDKLILRTLSFAVGLIVFVFTSGAVDFSVYALLSLPLLFLYNGEKGKLNAKYFFYIFYPLHLLLIEGLYLLLYIW